jgi:hypothetical protein
MEPIEGIPGYFWEDEFDISALSYSQFLDFFFDRPILPDRKLHKLFLDATDRFLAAKPRVVAGYLQEMCRKFSELTKVYTPEQLDQGLWLIFGSGISCEQYLFDPTVDLELRTECIQSMYFPFRDVVACSTIGPRDSFYWMWWDMILHTFWQIYYSTNDNYQKLPADGKQMFDAMYQTLLKILALDHRACQESALHGLGHLRHPLGRETVQRYLDIHRTELTDEDVRWVEACRDGAIA